MNIRSTMLVGLFVAGTAAFALAAGGRDGAVIVNSGSTNAAGYTVKIWSDGSASTGAASARVPQDIVRRFFTAVRSGKRGGNSGPAKGCMKSASFGSTTLVHYHGWTSQDLGCPGDPELSAAVQAVVAAVHPVAIRHPLMPNEMRRPEVTPTIQPSASPDFRSFAW